MARLLVLPHGRPVVPRRPPSRVSDAHKYERPGRGPHSRRPERNAGAPRFLLGNAGPPRELRSAYFTADFSFHWAHGICQSYQSNCAGSVVIEPVTSTGSPTRAES